MSSTMMLENADLRLHSYNDPMHFPYCFYVTGTPYYYVYAFMVDLERT